MEPVQDPKNFIWPKGRRWTFRNDGTRYVVRHWKNGWSISFKQNGLEISTGGRSFYAHTDQVSVNGITWRYLGSYQDYDRGWFAVDNAALPEGLPPKVLELANQALAAMEAHLTPLREEQERLERVKEVDLRHRRDAKNQARWAKQEEHLSEVLEQLG